MRLLALIAVLLGALAGTAGATTLYAPVYGTSPDEVLGIDARGDGSLVELPGSPFAVVTGPTPPVGGIWGLAFAPDGRRAAASYLFEGGAGGISAAAGGALAPAGPPIVTASATGLAVTPDGRYAYTPTRTFKMVEAQGIRGYVLRGDGSLVALPGSTGTDQSQDIAITPSGRFLYQQVAGGVKRYELDGNGALALLGTTGALGAHKLEVSPDGQFLFVGLDGGMGSDRVASFSIGAGGDLAPVGEPASTGSTSMEFFGVAPEGRRIYMPDSNLDGIVTAAVAPGGSLSVLGTMSVDDPQSVAVSPDGRFLYIASTGSPGRIGVASLDSNGIPTLLPTSIPWDVSDEEERLVIRPTPTPVARFTSRRAEPGANSYFDAGASTGAARYDWDFGDGGELLDGGPTPSHRYLRPGAYEVTLTVANSAGCSAEQVYTGQTTVCPGGSEATTTASLDTPPGIRDFRLRKRRFAVVQRRRRAEGSARRRGRAGRGTAFLFGLTEPARVTITIERKRTGRAVRGKCRRVTRRNRNRNRCVRLGKVGVINLSGGAGPNRRRFTGAVARKRARVRLAPGRYRATAVATDAAGGRSQPQRASFTVLRG